MSFPRYRDLRSRPIFHKQTYHARWVSCIQTSIFLIDHPMDMCQSIWVFYMMSIFISRSPPWLSHSLTSHVLLFWLSLSFILSYLFFFAKVASYFFIVFLVTLFFITGLTLSQLMPNNFSRVLAFERLCFLMEIPTTEPLMCCFHQLIKNKNDN